MQLLRRAGARLASTDDYAARILEVAEALRRGDRGLGANRIAPCRERRFRLHALASAQRGFEQAMQYRICRLATRCPLVSGLQLAEDLAIAKHLRLEAGRDAYHMFGRVAPEATRGSGQQHVTFGSRAHPAARENLDRSLDHLRIVAVHPCVQLRAIARGDERGFGNHFGARRTVQLCEALLGEMEALTCCRVGMAEVDGDRNQHRRGDAESVIKRAQARPDAPGS